MLCETRTCVQALGMSFGAHAGSPSRGIPHPNPFVELSAVRFLHRRAVDVIPLRKCNFGGKFSCARNFFSSSPHIFLSAARGRGSPWNYYPSLRVTSLPSPPSLSSITVRAGQGSVRRRRPDSHGDFPLPHTIVLPLAVHPYAGTPPTR